MKKTKLIILFAALLTSSGVKAAVITLSGTPKNYYVYDWDEKSKSVKRDGSLSKHYEAMEFNVPDEYVVFKNDGEIDINKTLTKWRKGTPLKKGNPKTLRTGYYPFKTPTGKIKYIALDYMIKRSYKYNDFKITVHPQEGKKSTESSAQIKPETKSKEVKTERDLLPKKSKQNDKSQASVKIPKKNNGSQTTKNSSALIGDFSTIYQNPGALSCRSNTGNASQCMVCNCYYEARGEPYEGMVGVNRVVLTRTKRQGFPSSTCEAIWYQKKSRSGKSIAAFSWTLETHKSKRMDLRSVQRCAQASSDAVKAGTWAWDHFYNPRAASPAWGPKMAKRGSVKIGSHLFLNSGANQKSNITERLLTLSHGGIQ